MEKLSRVAPALGNSPSIPAFSHFWLADGQLIAYDGGLSIVVDLDLGLGKNIGVPGSALLSLVKSGPKDAELLLKGGEMTIKMGRSRTTLVTLAEDEMKWPFGELTADPDYELELTEGYLDAIRRALVLKPKNPEMVEQYGVALYPVKEGAIFCTTDSSTIVHVEASGKLPRGVVRTLLPRKFAEQLVAQIKPGSKLIVSPECLWAAGDDISIYSNYMDTSTMTDLLKVVGRFLKDTPDPVKIPGGLQTALERAKILGGGEDPSVTLELAGGELLVYGKLRLGSLDEKLPLEGAPGGAQGMGLFSVSSLLPALRDSDRLVVLDKAAVFYGGDDFVYLTASTTSE